VYAPFAPYEIEDKPQFPWRSVLFDTSRNYFRIKTIKKLLDTMSRVKLNVFHWHITDSQSWPLSLKSLPELAEKGAYQTRIYSEDDVKDIVAFAAERGIDVVIEIDTPGHTASIWHSHPDYIACYGAEPWKLSANEPPAGQLRFANDTVVEFTQKVFSNVLELIQSPYLGTGGDEINLDCMNNDTVTSATLEEKNITLQTALAEFTTKTHQTILDSNRAPMVWEEMVLAHGKLDLNENTIIDLWKEAATGGPSVVAAAGFRMVRADYDYLYLDCGRGGWVGFEGGLNSWCDPFKTWHHAYS
jgi:hexosaminidase